MKIYEIGTGYTSIPAKIGAATEIVVEELAKSFTTMDIDYKIFDIEDENRKENNLNITEIKVPKLFRKKDVSLGLIHKFKRVIYSINLSKVLIKEIKKSEQELYLHFHNQYNLFFFLHMLPDKLRNKIKIFYTCHSYIWNGEWDEIKNTIKKKYFQEVYCIKHSDKIFVLNNKTIEHFINKYNIDKRKIKLIDNGVNTNVYKPIEKQKKDEIIFFQCGSICDRKNQLGAIKILEESIKQYKNIKYLYAGGIIDQSYQDKIIEYCKNNNINNNIEYCGEIEPGQVLNNYYNKGSAFIFPSIAEGFSLVIIEAMSCGIPVIMDNNSKVEVPEDMRQLILYYDDKESFKELIKNNILDEKKKNIISKKCRDLVLNKYSWNAVAKKYIDEFKKMTGDIENDKV